MIQKQAVTKTGARSGHAAELDFDLLPGLIGYQLRLTQLAIFNDFGKSLSDQAISPGRFGVLALIAANPGLTQSRLALATQLDRSTMVAVIDQLEARSLVERRAAPNDRRSNALWLTEAGKKLLRTMKQRVKAHETHITAALGEQDAARLIEMLSRIRKHLQPRAAGEDFRDVPCPSAVQACPLAGNSLSTSSVRCCWPNSHWPASAGSFRPHRPLPGR